MTDTRQRLAIVGFGRLGQACAQAAQESPTSRVVGIVRRDGRTTISVPALAHIPLVAHLRDLERPDAVLLCVPPDASTGAAREILQLGMPVVECAMLQGRACVEHYAAVDAAARHHRKPAVVGAGWDPGLLPLLKRGFEMLIPAGHTRVGARPGTSLHHTEAARNVGGLVDALVTESTDADGRLRRYVYGQLEKGADADRVRLALERDPLFAGGETHFFPVADIAALGQEAHGIVLERRGTSRSGAHQNILLEARFDVATFAARVMLDAAREVPRLAARAHRYVLGSTALAIDR